ncbi:MAG: hypothetical protein V8Q32_04960 [Anaerotignum faecicola]
MQDNRKTGIGGKVLFGSTTIFFYLPILFIFDIFLHRSPRSLTHLEGFSLCWYEKMFVDSRLMEAVVYTIVIARVATVISHDCRHAGGNRDVPFQKNCAESGRSGE